MNTVLVKSNFLAGVKEVYGEWSQQFEISAARPERRVGRIEVDGYRKDRTTTRISCQGSLGLYFDVY